MSRIGFGELIIILIIALVVLGPEKLPEASRALGKAIRSVKKYIRETTEELDVMEDVREIKKDIDDIQKDVRTMGESLEKSVQGETQKVEDGMRAVENDINAAVHRAAAPATDPVQTENAPAPAEAEDHASQTVQEEEQHG